MVSFGKILVSIFRRTGHNYGFALNLTNGIFRMRYHSSWEKPELMQPDQIYPITIVLYPTANLFAQPSQSQSPFSPGAICG